jgi:tripartite ATP-independent transporter DctM subunit
VQDRIDWRGKIKASKALVLPGFLIFVVMGLIVLGVTSVTEASAVGASGAFLCAAINRRLTWKVVRESVIQTISVMGMMMWIMIAAVFFSKVYIGLGAHLAIEQLVIGSGLGRMGVLLIMVLSLFVMGCFLDDGTIIFVTTPLYVPIIRSLGFDPVWYGLIFVMSMQIAYLTPPFGFNLFYMRAVAPPEITMGDIYRSVIPFVILQLIGLAILIAFPDIILWLPTLIFD